MVIQAGGLRLDLDRYTAQASGPPAKLSLMQLRVLRYLMKNAGAVVSRTELLEHAWGDRGLDGTLVRTFIKRLRRVLAGTGATDVIRTAPGGYMLRVEEAQPSSRGAAARNTQQPPPG